MPSSVSSGKQLAELTKYFMGFSNWEAHLCLYPDACHMRETEYHILFLKGLAPALKSHVAKERNDLLEFKQDHHSSYPETVAPLKLHARTIFKRLSAIVMPLSLENTPGTKQHAHVAAIGQESPHTLDQVLTDLSPAPEQIVAWCAQIGDLTLTDEIVAAFQRNFRRQSCPPLGDKRPPGLCPHLQCSNHHSPDNCCICNNQRHPIERFWHVIGLPSRKTAMLKQFKAQHASSSGPWAPKVVKSAMFKPTVASVLVADPKLVSPPFVADWHHPQRDRRRST
jgi:hypothetical protein